MLECGGVETIEAVKTQSGSWTAVAGHRDYRLLRGIPRSSR